ncbi:uncharacterized protein F4822DRAFT_50573 [Hypoxylon trugodes]|uniref:uncharacterized protein n=1 Tax=Hypoxylon trugodes TaxID=326681 RepID=UPI002194FF51|nr:uncharacterized protein F4822DRAFT_50573 [Hypoxylon trugodes]KAI1383770.1 hypothetical protein F4822DRAFT_50573 [Hypoxylon trugodes]
MEETPNSKIDRRRRRPALSCVSCRRSKIRCDRNLPCGACIRSKHKTCVYEPQGPPLSRHSDISSGGVGPHHPTDDPSGIESDTTLSPVVQHGDGPHPEDHSNASLTGSTPVDSASSHSHDPSFDVRSLLDRIKDLERRLEESTDHRPRNQNVARPSTTNASETMATYPSYLAGELHTMNKSVMSKTRYLGQSHWMNQIGNVCNLPHSSLLFKSVLEVFDQQYGKKTEPIMYITKAKALARTVKARRTPELGFKFGTNIPPRETADKLVDAYLRTLETVFRIVHVPSFRKEYEDYWSSPDSAELPFIIQLQLIMAIGTAMYDDLFSMRNTASQWVYEAQCWLISPVPKTRLTLAGLQNMLLLCLAREAAAVNPDLVWIPIGQLMRTAIFMGLHRDPKKLPKMNRFPSEMRRRLWNTILELALQTSVDSGGPPLIFLEQYDTGAPANCDDDQLTDDSGPAVNNPRDKFTDMSVALALRGSFSARLAVARLLNEINSQNTYDDTIRLHGQLSNAYKSLSQYLQRFAFTDRQPTSFQRRFLDFLVRRYFMALHLPYFGPAMTEPAYAFSRKTVVEIAAKLYTTVFPSAALNPRSRIQVGGLRVASPIEGDDLTRIATCGAGFFRSILSQVSMAIGLELQVQLQEDDSLGPPTPRTDLLNILRDSASWILSRIHVGETAIKGFMFHSALVAQAEGLVSGLKGPDLVEAMVGAASESIREGFEILKQQVEPKSNVANDINDAQTGFDTVMTMDDDWSFDSTMQSVLFDFTSIESVLGIGSASDMATADFSQW